MNLYQLAQKKLSFKKPLLLQLLNWPIDKPIPPVVDIVTPPTLTSTPTDSTESWKTYENKELGFTLKHPETVVEFGSSTEFSPKTVSFHKQLGSNTLSGDALNITISDRSEYKQYYLNNDPAKTLDDYVNETKKKIKVTTKETVIDNYRAIKIIYGDGKSMERIVTEPDIRGPIKYVLFRNGKFYIIEYYTDDEQLTKTFDQILSTFKFLDENKNEDALIQIQNGNVYKITSSGTKQLLINKNSLTDPNNLSSPVGEIVSVKVSPDKSKLLMEVEASYGLILHLLYYSDINGKNIQWIGDSSEASWSPNSRYIAYTSKPADAGPMQLLYIYDTKTNINKPLEAKEKTQYNTLGYSNIRWLDNSKGIKVHYEKHTMT